MNDEQQGSRDLETWLKKETENLRTVTSAEARTDEPVLLSIVIPAYNEQWRLPPTLVDMVDFLEQQSLAYEIIVVDDGSSDATSLVVRKFQRIRPQVKLITLPENRGKGFAVRQGVFQSRGKRILFADADGATPFSEIQRLLTALDDGCEVAIGSRAKPSAQTKVITYFHRKWLGRLFNFCVNQFLVPHIHDTQCGFKLFTSEAARFLFAYQRSDGFSFDVEILHICQRTGIRIQEVSVNWINIPGSKVNLVTDALKMLRDVFLFRFRYRKLTPDDYAAFRASSR